MQKQRTIRSEISLSGDGLHTGCKSIVTIKPSGSNTGITFKRTDLDNHPEISANIDNVIDTSRGTTLEENGNRIYTVEHVLSALTGMGIDNAIVEVSGIELPILNGSSKPYTDLISKVGIEEFEEVKKVYELKEPIFYSVPGTGIEFMALPYDHFYANVMVDYSSDTLPNQYAETQDLFDYVNQLAPARTFVFLSEIEQLLEKDLIKGGDLTNALVILEKNISLEKVNEIADKLGKSKIHEIPPYHILSDEPLFFPNEPARHKLLDLIGDLTLIGFSVKAKIYAKKPGHKHNIEFGKLIRQQIKKEKSKTHAPIFDINVEPLMDIHKIKQVLPHRYPFLFVDKILELKDDFVIGLKNVTTNEDFFNGHFPNEPVMPGVLIVEAMAQVGGILVLNSVPDPENYSTYFLKIDQVRFKKKVIPGDTLIFKLELLQPIRRGIAVMKGYAYVGSQIVMEGKLMAQIAKKTK